MKKILIIEDDENLKENISEILILAQYTTITAINGKDGIERAIKEKPDLILCDILMPGIDGYGVLYILSRHPNTSDIPFIFLSGQNKTSDMLKGLGLGADDYLTKPFHDIDLLNTIALRLTKAEKKNEHFTLNSSDSISSIIFSFINKDSENGAARDFKIHKFYKKQILYSEEQFPDSVYYVISGRLKEFKLHSYGKILITNIYTKDNFFGYHAIIANTKHKETVQVLEDSELLMIGRNQFLKLLNSNFDFALQLLSLIIQEEQRMEEQLLKMTYSSLRKKVAEGMMEIAGLFKTDKSETINLIDISREDLAHFIGSTPESLIRTLKEFKDEKLIDVRNGSIILLKEEMLKNITD